MIIKMPYYNIKSNNLNKRKPIDVHKKKKKRILIIEKMSSIVKTYTCS